MKFSKEELNGKYELMLPEYRLKQWSNPWELERLDSMIANILPGDTICDIGAEEGDISALLTKQAKGKTYLFEPSPHYWPGIKAIFEANGIKPTGFFVGFVSNETLYDPELKDFHSEEKNGWPACAYGEVKPDFGFRHLNEQTDSTPQVTLDSYFNAQIQDPEFHIDLITMDIEGAELNALTGMQAVLAKYKPLVYVSVHPDSLRDRYDAAPEDVLEYMAEQGYSAKHLATDHEEHWCFYHLEGRQLK